MPVTRTVLVTALSKLLTEDPGQFREVADHPETARALARAHDHLRLLPQGGLAQIEATSSVAADVVRMHRAASDRLAPTHYDEVDLLTTAASIVTAGAAAIPPVVLFLPGAPDPTQSAFVRALVGATDVTAIVGISGAEKADGPVIEAWRELLGEPEGEVEQTEPTADAVIAATDPDAEVRAVVRDVVARLSSGTPGHRIAVLYGSRDPYARLLAEHLAAAGPDLQRPRCSPCRGTGPGTGDPASAGPAGPRVPPR